MISLWKLVLLMLLLINWGNATILVNGGVSVESVLVLTREFLIGLRFNASFVDHAWDIPEEILQSSANTQELKRKTRRKHGKRGGVRRRLKRAQRFIPLPGILLSNIFSGLLVNLPSVADWLNWLKYLSIPRYGLVAVEINEFTGLTLCDMKNTSGLEIQVCTKGEDFLSEQGIHYSTWDLWQNHLALGIMTLIFLIIAYLKLCFIKKFT